jgi:GntR family transcriptional regulator, histidine utilization repressor
MNEIAAQSLHQRIVDELEQHILSGKWPPGHRIPSEAELVSRYDCSRMTVNKAISQLARAGLVARRRRAGTFVLRPDARSAELEIRDVKSEVEELGLTHTYTILQRKIKKASEADASAVGVPVGASLLGVITLHLASGKPFCYENRTISLESVPNIKDISFEEQSPGTWLVHNVPWTDAEHRIRAAESDPTVAKALGIASGAASLVVERRTWLRGQPVTHVLFNYPANGHEFVARFSPRAEE